MGHLVALVRGQRAAQPGRELGERAGQRVADGLAGWSRRGLAQMVSRYLRSTSVAVAGRARRPSHHRRWPLPGYLRQPSKRSTAAADLRASLAEVRVGGARN